MSRVRIVTIGESDLSEVAAFLRGRDLGAAPDAAGGKSPGSASDLEPLLRWRCADNPYVAEDGALGHCIRRPDGSLGGVLLSFAERFTLGERSLRGLCGGGFFVEEDLRFQGFLLFRRFVASPDADFVFATTCNPTSGALWQKVGADPVPDSHLEALFVLRAGPLVEELVRRRGADRLAASLGRLVGWLTPRLTRTRRGRDWKLRPTRDWDRLAELARRHRDPRVLTNERASAYLSWRYARSPSAASHELLEFEDAQGRQGWLCLSASRRGRAGQIHTWTLLDLVFPRDDAFDLEALFGALLGHIADRGDMLAMRGPAQVLAAASALGARRREFGVPLCYLASRAADGAAWARAVELFPGDGDTSS